jgi:hypothetical protein
VPEAFGIPVLIVLQPLPAAAGTEATRASFAAAEARISAIASRHTNVRLLSPALRLYPNELCATLTHLTPEGAARNTAEIVSALGQPQSLGERAERAGGSNGREPPE